MSEVHLLLDWQQGLLGCDTHESTPQAVPVTLAWKVTCAVCQQRTLRGPHKHKPTSLVIPPNGEAILMTGLSPLMGGRGKKMNSLEAACYAVLKNDVTVLRLWFEPCPLLLPGKVAYWPDFRVVMWDGSIRWIECKARKKTGTSRIVPRFEDDAKIKWKQAVERYTRADERFYLAIGWREQGAYRFEVREETGDE